MKYIIPFQTSKHELDYSLSDPKQELDYSLSDPKHELDYSLSNLNMSWIIPLQTWTWVRLFPFKPKHELDYSLSNLNMS